MGIFRGIQLYVKAFEILFSRRFWWFLLFPILILLLLFLGGNLLVTIAGDGLYGLFETTVRSWVEGISWLQWVNEASNILVKIFLKIIYFFLFVAFGGYLVLILMSPIFSWLSERTEATLSGREYPFSWKQFCWEIFRGIRIALRNMVLQLLFSLFFFLCSFIPLVGLLMPFALFLTSSYFYGFSFMDYAIERKRYNIKQSIRYVNKNRGVVTGIGCIYALALMIPWLGTMLCCFVSLLAVVASVIAINRIDCKSLEIS
jgi:CysZ protein